MYCPIQINRKRHCLKGGCCYESLHTKFFTHFLKMYGVKYYSNVEEYFSGVLIKSKLEFCEYEDIGGCREHAPKPFYKATLYLPYVTDISEERRIFRRLLFDLE